MAESPLQKRYNSELEQLKKDKEFLETRTNRYDDQINDIVKLSLPSDEAYAQTVKDANAFLSQIVNFAGVATGCGCSITAGLGITTYYEVAKVKMENASTDDYVGDDPQGSNGALALTVGIGADTELNPSNFGKGVNVRVDAATGVGASVRPRFISEVQPSPGICGTITCSELYELQQDAIENYNNAKSLVTREGYANKSSVVKTEAKEYRLQRWANEKGKKFTQDRIDRINAFYPETQ